jgi:putative Holliday junction resolvase
MASSFRASPPADFSTAPGVVLAIDYGKKRLGLALSDELGVTTRPFAVWTRTNRRRDLARLRDLARQNAVRRIVVGLPLHLDGTKSEMSEEAEAFAARIEKALSLPVELMDERLSSWEAQQSSAAAKSNRRPSRAQHRGPAGRGPAGTKTPLDGIAAAIILRDYLDRLRRQTGSQA